MENQQATITKSASQIKRLLHFDVYRKGKNRLYKSRTATEKAIAKGMSVPGRCESDPQTHIPVYIDTPEKGWLARGSKTCELSNGLVIEHLKRVYFVVYPLIDGRQEHRSFKRFADALDYARTWTLEEHMEKKQKEKEQREREIELFNQKQALKQEAIEKETLALGDTIENLLKKSIDSVKRKFIAARNKNQWTQAKEYSETLRKLRMNVFDAEDNARQAYEQNCPQLFQHPEFKHLAKAFKALEKNTGEQQCA